MTHALLYVLAVALVAVAAGLRWRAKRPKPELRAGPNRRRLHLVDTAPGRKTG